MSINTIFISDMTGFVPIAEKHSGLSFLSSRKSQNSAILIFVFIEGFFFLYTRYLISNTANNMCSSLQVLCTTCNTVIVIVTDQDRPQYSTSFIKETQYSGSNPGVLQVELHQFSCLWHLEVTFTELKTYWNMRNRVVPPSSYRNGSQAEC